MTFGIHVSGPAADAVARAVPALVGDLVASGITAQDPALWGPAAEADAARNLGWTQAIEDARALVGDIESIRGELGRAGVDRIVLCAVGGYAAAADVIARTARVPLTVLESASPDRVAAAVAEAPAGTAVVVADPSGTTIEIDALLRIFTAAFADRGIDPAGRIIAVTSPGSALETAARDAGHRVFRAEAGAGGRFAALSAYGLVPAGLAGAGLTELIREAEVVSLELAVDDEHNPALRLAAAIAGSVPRRDKLAIVEDGTHVHGLARWAERLIAGSTGKGGAGIVPIVLGPLSPELTAGHADVQVVRLVEDAGAHHLLRSDRHEGEILVSGSLGAQLLVWEYAVAAACRLLGVDPFDQPEADGLEVRVRARAAEPEDAGDGEEPVAAAESGIAVSASWSAASPVTSLSEAIEGLLARLPEDGYLAVQAFADPAAVPELPGVRDLLAARAGRPVAFGWGSDAVHASAQLRLGGPAGVAVLQIVVPPRDDVPIPGVGHGLARVFRAQARTAGELLAERGSPVLTLTLTDPSENLVPLFAAVDQ